MPGWSDGGWGGGVGYREADLRGWKMSSQSAGATQTQLTVLNVEMNIREILLLFKRIQRNIVNQLWTLFAKKDAVLFKIF